MIWAFLGALALATAGGLYLGMRRKVDALGREDGAIAILKDQLTEVASDRDRGLISGEEAIAAEAEIKRRLLAVAREDQQSTETASGRWAIAASAVFVPLIAGALYFQIGAPTVDSQPFAARGEEQEAAAEVAGLAAQLKARLEDDENGGPTEGWVLLGQTYMGMGRFADAADAFAKVVERDDADTSLLSRYAEALIAAENGIVTPQAERLIEKALELDPTNPAAVFYKAQSLEQGGALIAARSLLLERLNSADGFYPWMEVFVASVNRLGEQTGDTPIDLTAFAPMLSGARGPNAADVAAAEEMSEEDRTAFIRSMVDGLAMRLEEDPSDLEGWLRLIRAYSVLGDSDALAAAQGRARAVAEALPADDPRREPFLAQLDSMTN